jgi:hypothetical protein
MLVTLLAVRSVMKCRSAIAWFRRPAIGDDGLIADSQGGHLHIWRRPDAKSEWS